MSAFEFKNSLARAAERLAREPDGAARPRRDRGASRLPEAVEHKIAELLLVREKPSLSEVHRELSRFCQRRGVTVPSRATLYNAVERIELPLVSTANLPMSVREALYNLGEAQAVPAAQLVFYALNYGAPEALSYAAGAPWLWLLRASRLTGWRPKSFALLRAVLSYRGIS
ncbi:MAG: hypothetical protein H6718_22020 [Polyangiaceae bacterium]|nr:hypothetical protein [Polyangiaceae bacterium]